MNGRPTPLILQAVEALKIGERRRAAALMEQHLRSGPPPGDAWRSAATLLMHIGEIEMAVEAARRAAQPPTLDRALYYWGVLATAGRSDEALSHVAELPEDIRDHPSVLHFRGTVASERGDFPLAEELLRRAIAAAPAMIPSWFALAMIKTFEADDPDLRAMQDVLGSSGAAPANLRSQLLYAIAKAFHDAGDFDRAFGYYEEGAALRRSEANYDADAAAAFAERAVRDFTAENLARLKPSKMAEDRALFVTGLPRSGTTLVQQILTAHSAVAAGDEVNLLRPALIPTVDFSLEGALAYQNRSPSTDPWGDVARDYQRFLDMRFRTDRLVVDKSLGQSGLIGLMLHSIPNAKIIWIRRSPEDAAISSFRTWFTAPTPWSWSPEDIARHFQAEDLYFEHWRSTFPDRILVVPYEELVADPSGWTAKVAAHAGLTVEPAMERFHEGSQAVRTASVHQVRSPVSTDQVGAARRYPQFIERFTAAYRG